LLIVSAANKTSFKKVGLAQLKRKGIFFFEEKLNEPRRRHKQDQYINTISDFNAVSTAPSRS
jgi:hypothetical protein